MRKRYAVIVALVLWVTAFLSGCDQESGKSYYLGVEDLTLISGETARLYISTNDEIVGITSADSGIASVTPEGIVTGGVAYHTTITVRTKTGLISTCTVTVKEVALDRDKIFGSEPDGKAVLHTDDTSFPYIELIWEQKYTGSLPIDAIYFRIKGYDKNGNEIRLGSMNSGEWIPTTFDEYTAIVKGISPGQKILFFEKIYGGFELSGIAKLQIESVDVEFSDGSCGSCCYGWYLTF